uniref:Uncharacterized protein n=1 Tax=Nelumbo nucifera TaxID=4432 RepID=A0A823A048_NELNU|nr:TPA_asm: hypothetical protein HUJ06_019088 [Nelumbo nucifera]
MYLNQTQEADFHLGSAQSAKEKCEKKNKKKEKIALAIKDCPHLVFQNIIKPIFRKYP